MGDDGLSAAELVRVGLVVAWALAGLSLVVRPGQRQLGAIVLAAAALGGACVLYSGILHRDPAGSLAAAAALVRPLAAGLLPAVALHLIVGLPDGRLGAGPGGRGDSRLRGRARARAGAVGPTSGAAAVAGGGGRRRGRRRRAGSSHRRFLATRGTASQRMEWVGLAVVVVAEAALVVTALRVLAGWPHLVSEVVGAVGVLIPSPWPPGLRPGSSAGSACSPTRCRWPG